MNYELIRTDYDTVQFGSENGIWIECHVDVFEKMCKHPKILDYALHCEKKMFKISFSDGVKLPEYKYLNRGFLIC